MNWFFKSHTLQVYDMILTTKHTNLKNPVDQFHNHPHLEPLTIAFLPTWIGTMIIDKSGNPSNGGFKSIKLRVYIGILIRNCQSKAFTKAYGGTSKSSYFEVYL